jgi:hypothetical protein
MGNNPLNMTDPLGLKPGSGDRSSSDNGEPNSMYTGDVQDDLPGGQGSINDGRQTYANWSWEGIGWKWQGYTTPEVKIEPKGFFAKFFNTVVDRYVNDLIVAPIIFFADHQKFLEGVKNSAENLTRIDPRVIIKNSIKWLDDFIEASPDKKGEMTGNLFVDITEIYGAGKLAGSTETGQFLKSVVGKGSTRIVVSDAKETVSNCSIGIDMHKLYKADIADGITKFKEFVLPGRRKIDFLDFDTKTIYELKPNNVRAIKAGLRQLERYKKEIEKLYPNIKWKTKIETY